MKYQVSSPMISVCDYIIEYKAPETYYYGSHTGDYYDYSKWFWDYDSVKKSLEQYKAFLKDDCYPDYPVCNHYQMEDGSQQIWIAVTGFKKEEISVKVEDNKIIIKGKCERKNDKEDKIVLHNKIAFRDFENKFYLHEKQDSEKITSKLEDGILKVTIPLKEEIKKMYRQVTIE